MRAKRQSVGSAPVLTVWDYLDLFKAYMRAEKKAENTVTKYVGIVESFLDDLKKPASELTKRDMQDYKERLAARYCENSMSTMIAAVNHFTECILERADLMMKAPRRVDKPGKALTEDEVSRILRESRRRNLRAHAMICLMYYGGLRVSEVLSLRISDVDFDRRVLQVHCGKGKDYSTVHLKKYPVQALREYLKVRAKPSGREHADRLFLSKNGRPLSKYGIWKSIKLLSHDAGVSKNVYPHLFRHSMITHMAERGLSAPLIQAQSRHKSMDMLQKYIHLSQEVVREAYEKGIRLDPDEEPQTQTEDTQEQSTKETRTSEPDYSVSYVGFSKPLC